MDLRDGIRKEDSAAAIDEADRNKDRKDLPVSGRVFRKLRRLARE